MAVEVGNADVDARVMTEEAFDARGGGAEEGGGRGVGRALK